MSSWPGWGVSPHFKRWCRPSPAMPSPSSGPSPAPLPGPLPPALTSSATAFTAGAPVPASGKVPVSPRPAGTPLFKCCLHPLVERGGLGKPLWASGPGWEAGLGLPSPPRDSALPASNHKGKSLPVGLTLGPFLCVGNNDNTTMENNAPLPCGRTASPQSPPDLSPAPSTTPHFPSHPSSSPANPLPAAYCTCCALYLECPPRPLRVMANERKEILGPPQSWGQSRPLPGSGHFAGGFHTRPPGVGNRSHQTSRAGAFCGLLCKDGEGERRVRKLPHLRPLSATLPPQGLGTCPSPSLACFSPDLCCRPQLKCHLQEEAVLATCHPALLSSYELTSLTCLCTHGLSAIPHPSARDLAQVAH